MSLESALAATAAIMSLAVSAGPNGDRPDERHAWAVHDDNRPNAREVLTDEKGVPSDAIVLFDGTEQSVRDHWCDSKGNATKWIVKDGLFVCVPKSGMAYARDVVGDCQLHVEFRIPDPPGEGLGNSGVYVHGIYEIQILHSFRNTDKFHPIPPWKHANYADGQCGAIYGQSPPAVNPAREPGKWQSFDITFHPAVWDGETLVEPATLSAYLNGVLIQDEWKLEGPTYYVRRTSHDAKKEIAERCAVALQDHGHPVEFRNIWVRRIASRRANTVHGGDYFNAADAKKLRERLAAETLAKAHAAENPASRLAWLWESYCYSANAEVKKEIDDLTPKYIARISAWRGAVDPAFREELSNMSGFVGMGKRCGLFTDDSPLAKAVADALKATSSNVKQY